MSGASITVEGLAKVYADTTRSTVALEPTDLQVRPGEFLVIVGPSGCGKTTLLRLMAGLEKPTSGQVDIALEGRAPRTATIFQEQAVFPWRTVLGNVTYGLRLQGVGRRAARDRALDLLRTVGVADFADSYPHELSGGMRQRVGIARAFVTDPDVLFMDEPLAALDEQTKTVVQAELLRMWESSGKTVVYVTHSIDEALVLGDRVVVMTARPGSVKTTVDVSLARPRDPFALRGTESYAALSSTIWSALRPEIGRDRDA